MSLYSESSTVTSPGGIVFTVWGRNSTVHFDLSVECAPEDAGSADGIKYHRHLEHPASESECIARVVAVKALIEAGSDL